MGPCAFLARICCLTFSLFFLCEYLIYYLVLGQCSWPTLDPEKADKTFGIRERSEPLKVLVLSDPHLLGPERGYWIDKVMREWQMRRAFQTAISLQKPDAVFILGDLFDEGEYVSEDEFITYIENFQSIFYVPEGVELFVAVGNHDIGFHYSITPYHEHRFSSAFDAPAVRLITLSGTHFVIMNSMAMEGDECFLCRPAEIMLSKISERLECTKNRTCPKSLNLNQYSRPVIMQHFPLYRESDESCHEPDEAPEDEKLHINKERWDCLSKNATALLLDMLQPRVVFGGHTHHGCHQYLAPTDTHEYTVPSFTWRNKNNPSYSLAVFTPDNYEVSKCYMPKQTTVAFLYFTGLVGIMAYGSLAFKPFFRRQRLTKYLNIRV